MLSYTPILTHFFLHSATTLLLLLADYLFSSALSPLPYLTLLSSVALGPHCSYSSLPLVFAFPSFGAPIWAARVLTAHSSC